ncbi:unnamed protein product [Parnassius mnemosyne]|uniref:Uncharacterized protein n=1 Tax=Parnassius mnemosyne TaxID=213953 RepID=A0AAV1LEH4_9NEOP
MRIREFVSFENELRKKNQMIHELTAQEPIMSLQGRIAELEQLLNQKEQEISVLRSHVIDDQATTILHTKIDDLRNYFEESLSRIERSFVGLPSNNDMDIRGSSYVNWGPSHNQLLNHQYVNRRTIMDSITMAQFVLLNWFIKFVVDKTVRFPSDGVYVNINGRLMSLYVSRTVNACDFGERSMDHTENTILNKFSGMDDAKQAFYNNIRSINVIIRGAIPDRVNDIYDVTTFESTFGLNWS